MRRSLSECSTRMVLLKKQSLLMSQFSTLGGLLFGYDQGVISGVITMESFGARFPRVFMDSGFKGWFVSTLLLGKLSTVLSKLPSQFN